MNSFTVIDHSDFANQNKKTIQNSRKLWFNNFHGDSNPCSKGLSEAKKVINRHFVKVHLKEKYHIFGYQKHQRNVFQNAFGLKSF